MAGARQEALAVLAQARPRASFPYGLAPAFRTCVCSADGRSSAHASTSDAVARCEHAQALFAFMNVGHTFASAIAATTTSFSSSIARFKSYVFATAIGWLTLGPWTSAKVDKAARTRPEEI